jgi:hypothetical protein
MFMNALSLEITIRLRPGALSACAHRIASQRRQGWRDLAESVFGRRHVPPHGRRAPRLRDVIAHGLSAAAAPTASPTARCLAEASPARSRTSRAESVRRSPISRPCAAQPTRPRRGTRPSWPTRKPGPRKDAGAACCRCGEFISCCPFGLYGECDIDRRLTHRT